MPRKPSLTTTQVTEIKNNPEVSIRDFAKKFKVSHITIQQARLSRGAYAVKQEAVEPTESDELIGVKWTGFASTENL